MKEKVLDKEKIVPLKQPIEPVCWHKAFDSHERIIDRLLTLNENVIDQMKGMQKNMNDMNDVVKGVMKLIDGINGTLRTVISQLPKWDGDA